MQPVKVLVVDDSAFMRRALSDMINSDSALEVVGTARNGHDALQKIAALHPDVVTLDIEMPELNGLKVLETVMNSHPLPIIMLSSLTQNGAEQTVEALQLGAVDFIAKPSGQISLDIDKLQDEIIRKIKITAGTKKNLENFNIKSDNNTITVAKDLKAPPADQIENFVGITKTKKPMPVVKQLNKLIVIGTSTGGPKALSQVIPRFPANLDASILVVQHMPAGFTKSLAQRLDSISKVKVKEAEDGELILPGCAYIAPGDYHLKVLSQKTSPASKLLVKLDQGSPRGGHRPSVDEMLVSVAEQFWGQIVAVIMTGMGYDGTAGLSSLKALGAKVIAEHQSTCVVYGMPKSAIESGNVNKVVPLQEIADEALKML